MSSTDLESAAVAERRQVQVRLTEAELEELDAELAALPAYAALAITRSTAMRLALARVSTCFGPR